MTPTRATSRRSRRWKIGRWNKLVRRVHMFAGLLLCPWILFFGLSGMLFNHPSIGASARAWPVGPDALGGQAWSPPAMAQALVAELNDGGQAQYRLDDAFAPHIEGYTILTAPTATGRLTLVADMQTPRGVLVHREPLGPTTAPPFADRHVLLPGTTIADVETSVRGQLGEGEGEALEPLRAHPKIAPTLRLRVIDGEGTAWNVVHDLKTGALSGRPADRWSPVGLPQLLGKLHTTHHFPMSVGPLWFWALFEDLLGLAMVLWALTGLWMWWQIKPTRTIGWICITVALGVAAWIMMGTAESVMFDEVAPVLGPGDA